MTILVKGNSSEVLGYIGYDISGYAVGQVFQLNCVYDVCTEDLFGYISPTDKGNWSIGWNLTFVSGTNFLNTSRFQGAIANYQLGSWGFTSLGIQSHQEFLNFQSQRSPTFGAWGNESYQNYPQGWSPPYSPGFTGVNIDLLNVYPPRGSLIADTAFVQITGCSIEGASLLLYYYAIFQTNNVTNTVFASF